MEYTLTLVTPPTVEPISTDEAINYMRLDTPDAADLSFITGLIKSARKYCEDLQHRAYITQTWEMSLSKFPVACNDRLNDVQKSAVIEIPMGNLQTVDSVKYTDSANVVHTLVENTDYIVSLRGILGRISPPYNGYWPTSQLAPLDPIVIKFTCGYGLAVAVPDTAKQAMYMLIDYWYNNRDAAAQTVSSEIAFSVKALLMMDRIAVI
jgi:uncharacterized phiE125 gp8 family phage protein